MTKKKEPQGGDVYSFGFRPFVIVDKLHWYTAVRSIGRFGLYEAVTILTKSYFDMSTLCWKVVWSKWLKYMGQLAPRYKRLFWVYYINDKKQWVTKN